MSTPVPGSETPGPETDPVEADSLPSLLRVLAEDAQTMVEAEAGYLKAALAFALGRLKSIAIAAVLALFFLFFMLMALVVGVLIALGQMIGAWAAAGVVVGVLALLTLVFAWRVISGGRRMIAILTGKST